MSSEQRSAWVIRAGVSGNNHAAQFLARGVVAIGFKQVGDLSGMGQDEIRAEVEKGWADKPQGTRSTHTYQLNAFVNEVQPGDIVITPLGLRSNAAHLGIIESLYEYPSEPVLADWHHSHRTRWLRTVSNDELPASVWGPLQSARTITRIKDFAAMEALVGSTEDAIHLLLKWRTAEEPRTVELHREVAERLGAVWWGKIGDPDGRAAMSDAFLGRFRQQLNDGIATDVYLYRPGDVWLADLIAITTDTADVDPDLVPRYYAETGQSHNLWVKIKNPRQVPSWLPTRQLKPAGPRAADSPMETFLRSRSSVLYVQKRERSDDDAGPFFILLQDARPERRYGDEEGERYAFDDAVTGRVPLLTAGKGRFLYYRPGPASDGTAQSFFGTGTITNVESVGTEGDREMYAATLEAYRRLERPVPAREYKPPGWNLQHAIAEITRAQYEEIVRRGTGPVEQGPPGQPERYDMEWLMDETLWPQDRLTRLIDAISSGQVVLAGPPGTGKTFIARSVLKHLTGGDGTRSRTVQFHPSYGYEEFIEGLRPDWDEIRNTMVFRPVPGVVLQMNRLARDEHSCYVLMDEMNRANLPEVLGELLFLFEYRDEPVQLRFGTTAAGEPTLFELSPYLRFIGTMNTADRSIRSVDAAMRRRFEIFRCPPDPVVLERWYDLDRNTNDVPGLISGFDALNDALAAEFDEHHTVGHSFFMTNQLTPRLLLDVWERQIAPLLDEYFFDRPEVVDQYACSRFWPSVGD